MTSVGPMGLPQMVQKFYSIKSRDVVRRGMIIATVFSLLIAFGAYYTGALSHHFFTAPRPPAVAAAAVPGAPAPPPAAAATPAADGKSELPMLPGGKGPDFDRIVPQMLTAHTPSWFSTIVLLIVLAASMSTLASLVLVSSAAVVVDLAGAGDQTSQSTTRGLLMMRVLCGVFVAVSVILASWRVDAIVTLMSMSWGALAGAFIGPYMWGLFWRGVTAAGAAAGFVGGLCTSVGLFLALGPANAPMAASIGMVASLIFVPVVSLLTPRLPAALVAKAFGEAATTDP
jgi:SSS family solute:Na+ symporter